LSILALGQQRVSDTFTDPEQGFVRSSKEESIESAVANGLESGGQRDLCETATTLPSCTKSE